MTEKDPWALKLPWLVAISASLALTLLSAAYGLLSFPKLVIPLFPLGLFAILISLAPKERQDLTKLRNGLGTGLNVLTILMLGLLALEFPDGTWQANPLWILLFSRVYGIAFSTIHTTSIYAIIILAGYLAFRDRAAIAPWKWILIVFGSAGIHEWTLYFSNFLFGHWGFAFWKDAVWFGAFAILAFVVANPSQRKFLALLIPILFAFEFIYVGFFSDSDLQIGQYTLSAISDNLIEVLSWLAIPVVWLFYEQKKIS